MKFSLDFIKEFCQPEVSPQELAERLTLAGMEVGGLEQRGTDWVFEIEVTANRYDWLSLIGISREVAAVCNCEHSTPLPVQEKEPLMKQPAIIIENKEDCPLYVARCFDQVNIASSPQWLKKKLENCGLSQINNVVDITNYCMLKWGNPLHAFDADKIEGDIHIRRARAGELFLGIDGKERELTKENLVIADDKKVIALAGVMGAKNSEVDDTTTRIILEAALFSPLTVRRSRRSAGLETDSSYRFERRVLPHYVDVASREARARIVSLAKARPVGRGQSGSLAGFRQKPIILDLPALASYLGHEIPAKDAARILKLLGCTVREKKDQLEVVPPEFRLDIFREVDLYEEITRVYGYDRIPSCLPLLAPVPKKTFYEFKNEVRDFLVSLGLHEIVSFSITSDEILAQLQEKGGIQLDNPLRSQENVLRTTLLSGALDVARHNFNQKRQSLAFFELASVYRKEKGSFQETPTAALLISGPEEKVFYLKGIAGELMNFLGLGDYQWKEINLPDFTNALEFICQGRTVGWLGKVDSRLQQQWDCREPLYYFQIEMPFLYENRKDGQYVSFSRFPVVFRDISLTMDQESRFADLEKIIIEESRPYLKEIQVIDIYRDPKSNDRKKNITIRVYYQAEDKTLTSQEVDDLHLCLRDRLAEQKGIDLR